MATEKTAAAKKTRRTKKAAEEELSGLALDAQEASEPKKTAPKKPAKKPAAKTAAAGKTEPEKEHIFALDIGTRSVIGIVADQEADGSMTILKTTRREHKTRAMLDGQIHDVPQVAAVIRDVKAELEKTTGPLKSVAVAAAGRALYTMTSEAEMEFTGVITAEDERLLDFAGVQAAQTELASSSEIDDPTHYYCVGYSTIKYTLDGVQLKSLVGQRGEKATASIIATFLPRQVIDSMDSALVSTGLSLRAVTLEPIAAINVLIPPTMRHLNLVLVDIGAGTSDVAITKNGSVIAYGMVPQAGDEITEAISQHFLLDFNVAEQIKRDAADGKDNIAFTDILGTEYQLSAEEVFTPILPAVENLADAIAKQIMALNDTEPQAVLLVGGGSLTPHLAELVAKALSLPLPRVAVRHPDAVDGVNALPPELTQPDAVTPLGILKIASLNTLHFQTVYISGEEHRLFHFRDLTVSDALLAAGVHLQQENAPEVGVHVFVDGVMKFFPGKSGSTPTVTMNGKPVSLDDLIEDGAHLEVAAGEEAAMPTVTVADIMEDQEPYLLYINGNKKELAPGLLVNDEPAEDKRVLVDGDSVERRETFSVGEALKTAGYPPMGKKIKYKLNGAETQFSCIPEILLNDQPATLSMSVHDGDRLEYNLPDDPKLGEVLGLKERDTSLIVYFNGAEKKIPSATVTLELNGRPATANTLVTEGCSVLYEISERRATDVSAVLAAVGFEPPAAGRGLVVTITVNGKPAAFSTPIMNGDQVDVDIQLSESATAKSKKGISSSAPAGEPAPTESASGEVPAPETPEGKDGLLADYLAQIEKEKGGPAQAAKKSGGKDGLLADYLAQIEKEKASK
ncbi:MAG: rod shape-determining protein [Schwartzia sp.]|nr:rod shape-determining protein [Schwartzia sp. (in: firmicutes)]